MNRVQKSRRRTARKCAVTAVILAGLTAFGIYQNQHLTVTEYRYESPKLPPDADGFTIVQISDLHNANFGRNNARLLDTIRRLQPDLIAVTGDICDAYHTNLETAIRFCADAADIAPCYYVTGNHELWLDAPERTRLLDGIAASGTVILDDASCAVACGTAQICLTGLGDANLLAADKSGIRPEPFTESDFQLILAHEPQYFEAYCKSGADLVLTGHAHGGQFRLPGIGGIIAPDQGFFPDYTAGCFTDGQTTMYISRGLGNSTIPVRLFNYPEVVCVRMYAS